MRIVALAVLLFAGLAGCASSDEPLPPEWQGRDLRKGAWFNVTLQPQESLALEYPPWPSGTQVKWDWFTTPDQYQTFQLVRPDGSRVFARDRSNETGGVTVPQTAAHSLVWINDFFRPVQLTVQAPDGYQQRIHPPNEGPGCPPLRLC